ncbi:MAG: T9SS type A sorting domain-containing protein [Saprospiraceae bacterium]
MYQIVTILLFAFSLSQLNAQIPTFIKHHGTTGDDEARFVEVLPDNSFIVAGSSTEGGLGGKDAMLVKFRADGTVEWSRSHGGLGDEFFMHILACSDGNYIAVGETNSFGAGNVDIYVVKFDPKGDVIWVRTCGGAGPEWSCGGACEVSDGYIITGSTQSFGSGFWDAFVEKLDLNGSSIWTKGWGTNGADVSGEPLPGSNGDIWVSGGYFAGNQEALLFRLSSSGAYQSGRRLGGFGHEGGEFLARGGAGLSVSGSTWSYSNNTQYQPWIISFNASGNFVWGKRYVFPSGNHNMNAENCPDGGFVFTPLNINEDAAEAYLVRTDVNGNIIWAKSHLISGRMYHAKPCPDGGFVAVGYSTGNGYDMYIVKTNAEGNLSGCRAIDVPVIAQTISPGIPLVSPVATAGPSAGAPAAQDQQVGLTETIICDFVSSVSEGRSLVLSLVPNPTSGAFRFLSNEQILLDIQIFDSTGRLCFTGKTQTNQDVVPPNRLPAGMYMVYVTDSDGQAQQFRMARK